MYLRIFSFALLVLIFSCKESSEKQKPGKALFNGQDLSGWTQMGGEANYAVEDGIIVGRPLAVRPIPF